MAALSNKRGFFMTYLRFPWATSNGDKAEPPAEEQVDDSVSYEEGYSSRYSEDPATSGTAKRIERNEYNGALFRYSTEIQQYQQNGTPAFITSGENGGVPFPYVINSTVLLGNVIYRSNTAANVTTPPDASWDIITNPLTSLTGSEGITISGSGNTRNIAGPIIPTIQPFTASGAFNWTRPSGCRYIVIEATGGGGQGGGSSTIAFDLGGQGGGAGAYVRLTLDVTSIPSSAGVVGIGGSGPNGDADGDTGVASTFAAVPSLSAGGGIGGQKAGDAESGTTSIAAGGNVNIEGAAGFVGSVDNSISGAGGTSYWGGGGKGKFEGSTGSGTDGEVAGSGGGGATRTAGGAGADERGGSGATGIVIITEHY